MKKIVLAALTIFLSVSFALAASDETPASIYAKVIDKSYIGKYKSIIIDKEISSSELPKGMSIKSRTYFADNIYREDTRTKDESGRTMNIITVFSASDTYISYDAGNSFFSMGSSLIDQISSNLKNIDPFTALAVLNEKAETVNGKECYVIEDNGGGYSRKFYIEKKTYNVVKSIVSNEDILIVTEMSDYRKVSKYSAPFSISILFHRKKEDKETVNSTIKISSIQFNPSINKNIFIPKNVSKLPNIPGIENIQDMLQSLF